MPQCQFLFSAVFDSRKVTKEIFSESTKEVILRSFIPKESRSQKGAPGGGGWGAHTTPRRAQPCWPRLGMVWPTRAPPGSALSPIYLPRTENPKYSREFPRKSPSPPSDRKPSFGGQKSMFRHPAEMGKCPRKNLHRLH